MRCPRREECPLRKMRKFFLLLCLGMEVSFLSVMYVVPVEAQERTLNLENYLFEVLKRNSSIEADRLQAQAQWEDVRVTVADQRMQIILSPSIERWTYYPNERSDRILSLIFQQNLDLSGLYRANERKAIYAYQAALHNYGSTLNSILSTAEQAYWKCLFAKRKIELLEKILEQRKEMLDLLELGLREKLITRLDVTKGRIKVTEAESSLAEARGNYLELLEELAGYAGREKILPENALDIPKCLLSSEDLRENFERNPDILSARSNLDYTRMLYAIAKRENSITVQLRGTYHLWTDYTYHMSDVEEGEWDLLLYVEVPLADGGKKRANIQKNRNLLEEMEKRLKAEEENVCTEYLKALAGWEKASRNVSVLERQKEYSEANLNDTWILYQEHLEDVIPLMDALEKDEQAKTQLLDAQLNMYLARAKLWQQKGTYLVMVAEREAERTEAFGGEDHASARK